MALDKRAKNLRFNLCVLLISLMSSERCSAKENWHFNIYGATVTAIGIGTVITEPSDYDFANSFLAITVARTIGSYKNSFNFEIEGQVAQHFGDQDHTEINGAFVTRWSVFPWDRFIDTSFAVGEGLSLATEIPQIEKRNHDHASQFLNYLMFEIALALPNNPNWSVITRLHHRSGVFGLFDNVTGASNALGVGCKYTF